jgi:hypothetical protein
MTDPRTGKLKLLQTQIAQQIERTTFNQKPKREEKPSLLKTHTQPTQSKGFKNQPTNKMNVGEKRTK